MNRGIQLTRSIYQRTIVLPDDTVRVFSQEGPFGLSGCQKRPYAIFIQCPWFNQRGEFLGFGDLDINDLKNICQSVSNEEWFVVCRGFTSKDHLRVAIRTPEQYERLQLVGKYCELIICKGTILMIEDSFMDREAIPYQGFFRKHNITWSKLRRQDMQDWLMIENSAASFGDEHVEIEVIPGTNGDEE